MISEEKVREIHKSHSLARYTYAELRAADEWIRTYAITALRDKLKDYPEYVREFVLLMVRCHFGSAETDDFLKAMECYPEWMRYGS